jgi:hypothetical protein
MAPDGVDPDHGQTTPHQPGGVFAFSTPDVQSDRAISEAHPVDDLVELFRAARIEADIQGRAELLLDQRELLISMPNGPRHTPILRDAST